MDVARLGLAHEDLDTHLERYDRIRKAAVDADRPVGILVDLPGPKVRAGGLPGRRRRPGRGRNDCD